MVFARLTPMRPRTHIFAVAIEDYQDTSFQSVVYAEQDAQSFVEAWQKLGVNSDDCKLLTSDEATVGCIHSELRYVLSKVGPDDRFVMFLAGHINSLQGSCLILAHETRQNTIEISSLALIELLNEIRKIKCDQVFGVQSFQEFSYKERIAKSFPHYQFCQGFY